MEGHNFLDINRSFDNYILRANELSFFTSKRFGFKESTWRERAINCFTLASALIANGVHLVGRSFKYHRPRGFIGAGVDEPNAKLQVTINGHSEPNINATEIELVEGLSATSQNCWPSVEFDIGAINNFLKRFFPAGFYYKTFMCQKVFGIKFMNHLFVKQLD